MDHEIVLKEDFIKLGADRLGTSRIVKIAKSEQGSGY